MTDTHTHLYMSDAYPDGGISAVNAAIEAGVDRLVFPCVTLDSLPSMQNLKNLFPDNIRLALGLHPTEVGDDRLTVLSRMEKMLPGNFSAIGEVGVDLYHDSSRRSEQIDAFGVQLQWASEYNLPVIIHCREALAETLQVIDAHSGKLPKLIFHSFTGSPQDVEQIRQVCDPWFGINGVVTFKNAPTLRESLPEIGIEKILLETDAPWLSPVPYRGRRNESAHIPYICKKVAEVLDITPENVEKITDRSAEALFGFPA